MFSRQPPIPTIDVWTNSVALANVHEEWRR